MKNKKYKLDFEMVPEECWYANLRSVLSKQQWDAVRKDAYARAGGRCMSCGARASRLEAHERWRYDDGKRLQKLETVIAVCHRCHEVIHIGRTQLMGRECEAEAWFQKVNGCTYAQYRAVLGKANEDHRRRNLVPAWKLDVRYLEKFCKGGKKS